MEYLYIKSLHIIGVVSWFAGLFYIVRLFIYHTEAREKPENEYRILHEQFMVMERKLMNIITTPAMIITLITGIYMVILTPGWLYQPWMHLKLGFVVALIGYHHICQGMMKKLKQEKLSWTSTRLRIWNEVATIILVAIVFLVVLKNSVSWIWGLLGLILFSIIIMLAVRLYKTARMRK